MHYPNTLLRTNESFTNNRANAYVVNEILDASPQKLLLKIYDFAIAECKKKNIEKTNKALSELIYALRFDNEEANEIAVGLKRLYEFCQDQTRKEKFQIVEEILTDLRKSWISAFST